MHDHIVHLNLCKKYTLTNVVLAHHFSCSLVQPIGNDTRARGIIYKFCLCLRASMVAGPPIDSVYRLHSPHSFNDERVDTYSLVHNNEFIVRPSALRICSDIWFPFYHYTMAALCVQYFLYYIDSSRNINIFIHKNLFLHINERIAMKKASDELSFFSSPAVVKLWSIWVIKAYKSSHLSNCEDEWGQQCGKWETKSADCLQMKT